MTRSRRRWMPALLAGALVTGGVASAAAAATTNAMLPPLPYVHLRVTQQHNSAGNSVVSVWMSTNAGRELDTPTGGALPLVFTQPWHSACQASPLYPLPGGKTQLVYSGKNNNVFTTWQPAVSFPTNHAQQLTVCAYLVNVPDPEFPFSVVATARTSVAVLPPRGRSTIPFNQGPWRTCYANRADQLLSVLANARISNGCATATTIANTWIAQWRGSVDERDNCGSWWGTSTGPLLFLTYPQAKWTAVPVSSLHRTLMCQESAVNPHNPESDLIVNCGLATFRFAPSL